jgi:hypothetical protein
MEVHPIKMVLIGIDPYPYNHDFFCILKVVKVARCGIKHGWRIQKIKAVSIMKTKSINGG